MNNNCTIVYVYDGMLLVMRWWETQAQLSRKVVWNMNIRHSNKPRLG